ncbi:MAG: MurT ligase domain-containing protein, partial [Acidimicrobiales bacterium]
AKNPAGWAELLELLRGSESPVVVGINARVADGHDPSWLWDVNFEEFTGRDVVATGERCGDLAVRLKYAGLRHATVPDQREALSAPGVSYVEYVGNYTAFQQLRRAVVTRSASKVPSAVTWHEPKGVPEATESFRRVGAVRDSVLRIAVVHPDLLGTYGDGGNGKILACRAAWRGWPVELLLARSDMALPSADIYCIGGGEDAPQVESAMLLQASILASAVDGGAAVLAVCAGFQVVGRSFPDANGSEHEGLGLLDVVTTRGTGPRSVGEVTADPVAPAIGTVSLKRFTGFENHSGVTRLGTGCEPLGTVASGVGNGDGSNTEGAWHARVVGTYLHGPVLARNPALADAMLHLATGRTIEPLDDSEEDALRIERLGSVRHTHGSRSARRTLSLAELIRIRG